MVRIRASLVLTLCSAVLFSQPRGSTQVTYEGALSALESATRLPPGLPLGILQATSEVQIQLQAKAAAGLRMTLTPAEVSSISDALADLRDLHNAVLLLRQDQFRPTIFDFDSRLPPSRGFGQIQQLITDVQTLTPNPNRANMEAVVNKVLDDASLVLFNHIITGATVRDKFLKLDIAHATETNLSALITAIQRQQVLRDVVLTSQSFKALSAAQKIQFLQTLQSKVRAYTEVSDKLASLGNIAPSDAEVLKRLPMVVAALGKMDEFKNNEVQQLAEIQKRQNEVLGKLDTLADSATRAAQVIAQDGKALSAKADEAQRALYYAAYNEAILTRERVANTVDSMLRDTLPPPALLQQQISDVTKQFIPAGIKVFDPRGQFPIELPQAADSIRSVLNGQVGLIRDVNNYLASGNQIFSNITQGLKLPTDITSLIPKLSLDGDGLKSIASTVLGSNFAGALAAVQGLSALGSIFGGGLGGGDMAALNAINQKLDQILENQKRIMKQLDQIEGKIDKLTQDLARDHEETMEKLLEIQQELTQVRDAVRQANGQHVRECDQIPPFYSFASFNDRASSFHADIFEDCFYRGLTDQASIPEVSVLFRIAVSQPDPNGNLTQFLTKRVGPQFSLFKEAYKEGVQRDLASLAALVPANSVLALRQKGVFLKDLSLLEDFRRAGKAYDSLPGEARLDRLKETRKAMDGDLSPQGWFDVFGGDSEKVRQQTTKEKRLEAIKDLRQSIVGSRQDDPDGLHAVAAQIEKYYLVIDAGNTESLGAVINDKTAFDPNLLLDSEQLRAFSEKVVSLSPYLYLYKEDEHRLYRDTEVLSSSGLLSEDHIRRSREKVTKLLRDTIKIVNSAIAQQSVLGGDVLLPRLVEWANKSLYGPDAKEPERIVLTDVFPYDPELQRNFVMFLLHDRVDRNNSDIAQYATAFGASSPEYIQKILAGDVALKLKRSGSKESNQANRDPDCGYFGSIDRWYLVLSQNQCVALPDPEEFRSRRLVPRAELVRLQEARDKLVEGLAADSLLSNANAEESRAVRRFLLSVAAKHP